MSLLKCQKCYYIECERWYYCQASSTNTLIPVGVFAALRKKCLSNCYSRVSTIPLRFSCVFFFSLFLFFTFWINFCWFSHRPFFAFDSYDGRKLFQHFFKWIRSQVYFRTGWFVRWYLCGWVTFFFLSCFKFFLGGGGCRTQQASGLWYRHTTFIEYTQICTT